jgi:hypothetical protein
MNATMTEHEDNEFELDYKGDKLLDHYSNISPYLRMEYSLFSYYEINYPFYFKQETRIIELTSYKDIDEQVYRYLNAYYEDFKDADNLIVRLNCPYNKEELHLEVFSVYKEKSEGLMKCHDFIDYLNICLYTNNLPSALFYLNKHIWKDYPISQQNFLRLLPIMNSGIFKYYHGENESGEKVTMVNPISQWGILNNDLNMNDPEWDMSEMSSSDEENKLYDMLIRSVYNL